MSRQPELCPGCGAEVHPKATECPECGTHIHRPSRLLPVLVGVIGVVVAIAAGAGVWVLLGPSPAQKPVETAAAPPAPPAPAPVEAPPAAPPPASPEPAPAPAPAPPPVQASPIPAGDEATRRAFAKTTQDNFVQNGLDLAVTTSGPNQTTIAIKFSFPAKTAVELIVGGPFPRQCRTRGFTTILFTDTSGASWSYDIETEKLTQK
ncbi:zinc ribbon domain-containing protein [Aquabacter sp. L1I39]|uniref:zinc ribbon domain-containing protein n=1 Tax=Aquabacter sp. L1I39 TaxID=2820278 RepID=UPI001ADD4177|nr:zinc ribbon domain-containing protein [Aquabacter sp. L1I39]QTL05927.1 zinc ribbon domain-containing protein [Aquabacter sp. L1I39]